MTPADGSRGPGMHNEDAVRFSAEGRNLTAQIVHELGRAIVTGRDPSGAPFPVEADLCRQYGASRPVLREAVKMLAGKALLASRPRQGTSVRSEDQWNLLDPDVLRWILERKFSIDLLIEFTDTRLGSE